MQQESPMAEALWATPYEQILDELGVSADTGLDGGEVQRRRRYGPNRLRQAKPRSAARILLDQFKSAVVLVLLPAAIASFAFREIVDDIELTVSPKAGDGGLFFPGWLGRHRRHEPHPPRRRPDRQTPPRPAKCKIVIARFRTTDTTWTPCARPREPARQRQAPAPNPGGGREERRQLPGMPG